MVIAVAKDIWFRGEKDERQVTILNCIDRDAHLALKLKESFDYQPSREEAAELNLDVLDGAELVLAVSHIKPSSGGRLKLMGQIDRSTLPKAALTATAPVKG
jgi:hypothetical protein